MVNVLIACEESQRVCCAFRELGFNAYSCDIQECSGEHPEWHILGDCMEAIFDKKGTLQTGEPFSLDGDWDLLIAHPPCTFLTIAGNKWYFHPDDKHLPVSERRPHPRFPNRYAEREEALEFFIKIYNAPVKYIAVENPIGIIGKRFRPQDQIIHPWFFGDSFNKRTALWLKNLPNLIPTNVVEPGESLRMGDGKVYNVWYSLNNIRGETMAERQKRRSKTFPGIAKAMAEQWGGYVKKQLGKVDEG